MSEASIKQDDLPTTWALTNLGSVINYGSTSKAAPNEIGDDDWVLELEDIEKDSSRLLQKMTFLQRQSKSTKNHFQAGDVLYGKLRPYLNKVLIANEPGYCTTEILPLKTGTHIDNRYLFYWLKHPVFLKYVEAESHGMNMPRLGTETGKAAPFVLAPRNEQTRIADQLDTLLARVQACNDRFDAIPALLKRFRQAVLNVATSGRLTEEWRTRRLSNLGVKESGLQTVQSVQQWKAHWLDQNSTHNESSRVRRRLSAFMPPKINPDDVALPEEWANVPLEDAVLMVVDCHNKTAPYCESGIPLVRTSNIRDGKIIWDDLRYVDEKTYAFWSKRCPPSSGDLIFTREAPIGEVAIVPPDMKLCLGQRTMLLSPVEHLISARYIQICLMAPAFRRHSEVRAVGSGVKHYRVGDVSELEIPISGFSEQAEIVRRVDTLFALADRIEARCTAARTQAQRLTPLVLAKAFRGELVSQDPTDEPASALLARIASANTFVAGKNRKKVPVALMERAQGASNL